MEDKRIESIERKLDTISDLLLRLCTVSLDREIENLKVEDQK